MRIAAWVLLSFAAFVSPMHAAAQYPAKPIRLIIPFPPGGSNDVVGPFIATETTKWARVVKEADIRAE